ncbi:MAG: UDP-3-O-(3-hydroxymyristoyl)glucosamine N-acyltransferase [Flavobacteriaceae bacterium]
MSHTIEQIAEATGASISGDADWRIDRLMPPNMALLAHDLALAMNKESLRRLPDARSRAVVVLKDCDADLSAFEIVLRVTEARGTLSRLTTLFAPEPSVLGRGVHPLALVDATAELGQDVFIGPFCTVGAHARIGDGSRLISHVAIGAGVEIGSGGLLHPGVRIGDRCRVGARAIIHGNAVIGADGFGFATADADVVATAKTSGKTVGNQGALMRIASLGTVEIGDDVEIGAGTCIDRATFAATRIGNGTKIDNLVQIGHNVTIGRDCRICGCVALSGSAVVGDRTVVGGNSGVADRVEIGEDVLIMASSSVGSRVPSRSIYGGAPAVPRDRALEQVMNVSRLRFLFRDVKRLKERMANLEGGPAPDGDGEDR